MAREIVTFSGPTHQIKLSDQQKVVDQILDHLGMQVVQVKPGCYVVENVNELPETAIYPRALTDNDNPPLTRKQLKRMKPNGRRKKV